MAKDYVETATAYEPKARSSASVTPTTPPVGHLQIGVVTYEDHPIHISQDVGMSIGAMIDQHIADTIKQGKLINEVALHFETREQQIQVAQAYSNEDKRKRY